VDTPSRCYSARRQPVCVERFKPGVGFAMIDPRDMKPIGTRCATCQQQANVLTDKRTPDGPMEEYSWTCPRCGAANTILAPSNVVGVAVASVFVVSEKQAPD